MTVRFDHLDPHLEKNRGRDGLLHGLDYSPLPRLTGRSLAMGLLVSMGGLIFGYDTGQISGFLEMPDFLERFGQRRDGEYYFSTVRSGLIVALLSIGTLIGALVAAPLADAVGRRPSISFWCLIASVGFVVQIAAVDAWYQVMIGRLVAGLGVGALSLLVPMYQAETAPAWIRGAMVCAYQLFITMGIFLAACFNYGTVTHYPDSSASWRIIIGLGWVFTIVLGVGILFFPETPRFDFRHGREERAAATICRVYGATEQHYAVRSQIDEIASKLRAERKVKASSNPLREFTGMFRAPRMSYRIALGVTLQCLQQLTGANYYFYYSTTVFRSVSINSYITQIIFNTINFLVTFLGLYIVEKYGRRKSLIIGALWMSLCFLIFGSVGHFALDVEHPERTQGPGVAMIVLACLFILGYATTWGPIIWALQAEIFPSRYRAKGMALSTASNWTWNFLIAFFTPFITSDIDFALGYVFAGCNLAAAVIVYFFVIESKGRTLEEIDTMYLEHVTPWKSSSWQPPSPEHMAKIRRRAGVALETPDDDEAPGDLKDGGQGIAHRENV
ncbi:hexose transporter [Stachybotrys elegans]|uniref:Hexose transporter n=1 Tax=Stachybotrys elegans TaxID=80388 RepID=A0A8K0SX95_9HYPO|nr:hexose transporter [Stachybotrys elegans]